MTVLAPIETFWRGTGRFGQPRQLDFHLPPQWVEGGSEDLVLEVRGRFDTTGTWHCSKIQSFLGVMPGDVVEMAADVMADDQRVMYSRSVHKETAGIYDAWSIDTSVNTTFDSGFTVMFTCRVNGDNRDGKPKAFFEGLIRLWLEETEPTGWRR